MDWREALFSRRTMGVRLGFSALKAVDEALGHPGANLRRVQVLGTNGKGSTAAMLAHLLASSGRRTGLYTSPHLHRVGERVRIDGEAVADLEIHEATQRVLAAESTAGRELSFFELLTLAAWCIFEARGVQDVVLEAGLGGRLDATSLRPCDLHLLCAIGLDHQAYLGHDLASIVAEKIAVFHEGARCLALAPTSYASEPEEALALRRQIEHHAHASGEALQWIEVGESAKTSATVARLEFGLMGKHQRANEALAMSAALELGVAPNHLGSQRWRGLSWPGRAELVRVEGGRVLLDVAHNDQAVAALVRALRSGELPMPGLVVFGASADKGPAQLSHRLASLGAKLWWAPPTVESGAPPPVPGLFSRAFIHADDEQLFVALDEQLACGAQVLVCGSHFVVAPLRAHLLRISPVDIDSAELTDPVARC